MTRDQFARGVSRRLAALVGLIAVASVSAAFASLHWFLELFSHFPLQYAAGALVLAVALWRLDRRRWAALGLALAAWNGFIVASAAAHYKPPEQPAGSARLAVFHFNAGFEHKDPRLVVDYVLANADRFDVVVLIEANSTWQDELKRLQRVYPHAVQSLEDSPFGIAVWSKLKPTSSSIVSAPHEYRHSELRLAAPGFPQPIAVYAIHPPPPVSAYMAGARDDKLAYVARAVREHSRETAIVVGDLNVTPYSPRFAAFRDLSGLDAVGAGVIPQNTWPVLLGGAWLGIPIDHSFIAPGLKLVSRDVGPDLGSDHLPITLTIAPR